MSFFSENAASEVPLVVLIGGVVLFGLWVSNIVYDNGLPNYISRKIGHGAGGLAFLASWVLSSPGWPIIVSAAFGLLLLGLHWLRPDSIRGVGGSARSEKVMAEVWFPLVAVPVYTVSWLWLNQPGPAIASLLFMAWGDGATGIVRYRVYNRPVKGLWGSLAMFLTCLAISWVFIRPFWIGAIAAIVATAVERLFGDNGTVKWADDNWTIPLASLAVILGLMRLAGQL